MAPADRDQLRAAVAARYAGLARAAQAGRMITDGDPDASAGCAAVYPDADDLPEAAVRASLGCGNPVAVADLQPGETVLDLGSGGGIDVLLSARRVGPAGKAYGHHGRWRDVVLIERRSPAVLTAPGQDRPQQQPRAETQPGRAGSHGRCHRQRGPNWPRPDAARDARRRTPRCAYEPGPTSSTAA